MIPPKHHPSLRATAYHEAGHAVASVIAQRRIQVVTIVPDDKLESLGICRNGKSPKWFQPDCGIGFREEKWIDAEIRILLAGLAAEKQFQGRHNWVGAGRDFHQAASLAGYLYEGRVLDRYLAFMVERTKDFISARLTWIQVEAVAESLLEHNTLSGSRVRSICRDAIRRAVEPDDNSLISSPALPPL